VLINNPITPCIWYIDTGNINVSKQAINETFINDKLQSRVATYLRYGGVNNNQIKKGLLLSLTVKEFFLKSVNIWQSYKQERGCLVHFFVF